MRIKAQTILKAFHLLGMLLFCANASASYFLECVGLVTIKSRIAESGSQQVTVDIDIHKHTFTCSGYAKKINIEGTKKNSTISFSKNIDEKTLQAGTHLEVRYKYKEPRTKFSSITKWKALKVVETIPFPTKQIHKNLPKPKQIPRSPSEGIDLHAEESLWGSRQEALHNYQELESTTPSNNKSSHNTNEVFSIYRGSFFKIIFPKPFIVKPLKPIERFDINHYRNDHLEIEPKLPPSYLEYVNTEEATFTSPDGLVEFFVYAKDSSDHPMSYLKVAKNEIKLSSKSKKISNEEEYLNYILKAWVTLKAKNNSYYRSYLYQRACHVAEQNWDSCESQVIGIKYSNTKAYNKYRDLFITFNQSLVKTAEY